MKKFAIILGIIACLASCGTVLAQEPSLAKAMYEIATLTNSEKYSEALTYTDNAIKIYPNNAELLNARGMILLFLDSPKSALVDINKAVSLDPRNDAILVSRGICKYELGDYMGASADFNKAIELNPKNDSAYSMRGLVKLNDGDFDGAETDFTLSNMIGDENIKRLNSK